MTSVPLFDHRVRSRDFDRMVPVEIHSHVCIHTFSIPLEPLSPAQTAPRRVGQEHSARRGQDKFVFGSYQPPLHCDTQEQLCAWLFVAVTPQCMQQCFRRVDYRMGELLTAPRPALCFRISRPPLSNESRSHRS